jgi:hypothetical protein
MGSRCSGTPALASVCSPMPSRQPLTFGYTAPTKNEYFDTTISNCEGNDAFEDQDWWQYLTSFTDKQTGSCGAVAYQTAYSNTHNVPTG